MRRLPSRALAALLSLASLAFTGCASGPGAGGDDEIATASDALISDYQDSSAVYVLDSGWWQTYQTHGGGVDNFWVDFSIRNDAYTKNVGIVWSIDHWQTTQTATAHYKGSLGGNRERWGLDVTGYTSSIGPGPEVEYAGFVTMNGQTQWSVFRNHYVFNKVTVDEPLRLLSSELSINGVGQPVFSASARALNVPASRQVYARYTTDGWSTWADAQATFDGTDFQLAFPLTVSTATTEKVDFALRLDTAGESRWDNNNGQNYSLRLAPRLLSEAVQGDPTAPTSGIEVASGSFDSALPLTGVAVGIDGSPATPAAFAGLSFNYPFDSSHLADGTHTLRYEVTGAGGFQRTFAGPSFLVKKDLAATASWRVPVPSGTSVSFDAQRTSDGSYYVLFDNNVARYASVGASAPAQVFAQAPISYVLHDLTVDGQGRVYAVGMDGAIVRWLPGGGIDTGFGNAGVLALTGTVGSSAICNVSAVEATANYLYVVDSCNARVLRLTPQGALVGEISLGTQGIDYLTSSYAQGGAVWVLLHHFNGGAQTSQYLLALDDASIGAPSLLTTVGLDAAAGDAQYFAVTDSAVWVTNSAMNLVRLSPTGVTQGTWLGGCGDYPLTGSLQLPSRIDPLADGSVAVLSWGSGRVETFAPLH